MREYSFGPVIEDDGVLFRFWAPRCETVLLAVDDDCPREMEACDAGWFQLKIDGARPGTRYRFQLPGGLFVPDPASRYQPDDVFGPQRGGRSDTPYPA